jgi:hypothetical protein
MLVVIQCAARKRRDAGHLKSPAGQLVTFVAKPNTARASDETLYAHPDDLSGYGGTWRDFLLEYNENPSNNPVRLLPAWHLYESSTYDRLVDRLGVDKVFILSAGWGLIRADFLTPYYDITFAPSAEAYKRRRQGDRYRDFCMLPPATREDVVFFGGRDYLPLFCSLTNELSVTRTVFYNSARVPPVSGCELVRFHTATRTNWHYECAKALLDGALADKSPFRV